MRRPGTRDQGFFGWLATVFGGESTQESVVEVEKPVPQKPIVGGNTSSSYMHFHTTFSRNNATMLQQLSEARRYRGIIEEASRRYNIQPAVLCGIGSRESHWGLALKPPGPSGTGDFTRRRARGERSGSLPPDGRGYGRGLVQIDYDWHEFARTGAWYNPRENILYGCKVLDQAKTFFQKRTHLHNEQLLRAMIAAYNGGATATLRAVNAGKDIDANTTGRDYSKDVLNRSGWFQLHGWR